MMFISTTLLLAIWGRQRSSTWASEASVVEGEQNVRKKQDVYNIRKARNTNGTRVHRYSISPLQNSVISEKPSIYYSSEPHSTFLEPTPPARLTTHLPEQLPDPIWPQDFTWSSSGELEGYECLRIYEGCEDNFNSYWEDNYFCWRSGTKDPGLRWTQHKFWDGSQPNDLKCTNIVEDSEPDDRCWTDNYLCVPNTSTLNFTWSQYGPLGSNQDCIQWEEPQDPHGWDNNFLCAPSSLPSTIPKLAISSSPHLYDYEFAAEKMSFESTYLFSVRPWGYSYVATDINGDGHIDMIHVSWLEPNRLFINKGDGTFQDPTNLPGEDMMDTTVIIAADMDNDGDIDLVVGNDDDKSGNWPYSASQYLLLNKGDGTFDVPLNLPGGPSSTWDIAVADLNNDGYLDIALASYWSGDGQEESRVLINNRDGTFDDSGILLGYGASAITIADINEDGHNDIIVGYLYSSSKLFINGGCGDFSKDPIVLPDETEYTRAIAVMDVNNDGLLDVILGGWSPNMILLNRGDGIFDESPTILPGGDFRTKTILVEDVNQDGYLDLVIDNERQPNQLLMNKGDGTFDEPLGLPGENSYGITAVDINSDGMIDFVLGNGEFLIQTDPSKPSSLPSFKPSLTPSSAPSYAPSSDPSLSPSVEASMMPSTSPSSIPSDYPTRMPSVIPSLDPSPSPSVEPSMMPSMIPSSGPSSIPSLSSAPSTSSAPSLQLCKRDSCDDSVLMYFGSTKCLLPACSGHCKSDSGCAAGLFCFQPGEDGTVPGCKSIPYDGVHYCIELGLNPSSMPSSLPTSKPSTSPTFSPSVMPSNLPTVKPSTSPTLTTAPSETSSPSSSLPSKSSAPSFKPSISLSPSESPSKTPSWEPSLSLSPSSKPSNQPTNECEPGHYITNDGCTPCEPGYFQDRPNQNTCVKCGAGTYQNEEGKSICKECDQGKYQPDVGKTSCMECEAGSYQNKTGGIECTKCNLGYYQPGGGKSSCHMCEVGKYQNTTGAIECIDCQAGTYQNTTGATGCIDCHPSTSQLLDGQENCKKCIAGTYQHLRGQLNCFECERGSVQGKEGQTGCELCKAGEFQPMKGGSECIECDAGSFQPLPGQESCTECRAGGYCATDNRAGTCDGGYTECPIGKFNSLTGQSDESSCIECPIGTYSDNKKGLIRCLECPYRLSSIPGSPKCPFCAENFYLKVRSIDEDSLNKNPGDYCLPCPVNATCPRDTTIETMQIDEGFWRDSKSTERLYKCNNKVCLGISCVEGHKGVLCEVCNDTNSYFNSVDGKCTNCPSFSRLGIVAGILAGSALLIWVMKYTIQHFPDIEHCFNKVSILMISATIQAKVKIMISFYQVFVTLEPIYGVSMHEDFKSWFSFLELFNFDFAEVLRIPSACYGTMRNRLYLNAGWPYGFVLLLVGGIFFHSFVVNMRRTKRKDIIAKCLYRSLHVTIITFYLVLPSVCRNIFDAVICKSFVSNDAKSTYNSYLIADWSLECNNQDSEYKAVQQIFWALFVLWPVTIPLVVLGLLLYIRPSVRSNSITSLAEACRFLWMDYDPSMMFWDFIDLIRKISLTGLIIFIDTEEGSERILRLLVAATICLIYVVILSRSRPYKGSNDLDLAILSNLLLTCCFIVGIVIHQCKEEEDVCHKLFRLSDSYQATLVAVILTSSMLIAFIIFVIVQSVNEIKSPTVKLVSTNNTPNLGTSSECKYHLFFSHVWLSGQDKTHKIVRMLKLYLQGLNIWLDVDELKDIGNLEQSVAESAHFLLFYSKGYFCSANCRREVMKAMEEDKPITVVYEPDDTSINNLHQLRKEFRMFWPHDLNVGRVVEYVFAEDPVEWISNGLQFSLESIKLIVGRLLNTLPYYQSNPGLLGAGLKIDGEIKPVEVLSTVKILYCSINTRARELAEKLVVECRGDLSVKEMNILNPRLQHDIEKAVMLVYLNINTFREDPEGELSENIKYAVKKSMTVVFVHEKDTNKGGCSFNEIIAQTPEELLSEPYNIYSNDLAISMYSVKEYEKVGLRQVLNKMGAQLNAE